MKPRIEEILRDIEKVLEEESHTFEEIKKLQDFRMDEHTKELVLVKLFELTREEKEGDISPAKLDKMATFMDDLALEVSTKGENLWGLFSGVTRYTTHSMKRGDNTENKIFGAVGKKEQFIYSELLYMMQ